jgi:GT2 family glycosyltransferase
MTIIYSVIIPAYNEEVWLAKSLPSLTAAMAIVRFPFRLLSAGAENQPSMGA